MLSIFENQTNKWLQSIQNWIDRTNPNTNTMLNKYIQFNNNKIAYVTNKGIVRPINSENDFEFIMNQNGCPSKQNIILLNIPWNNQWKIGQTISSKPPLILGTSLNIGESCGMEGSNVTITKIYNYPSNVQYVGCYQNELPQTLSIFVPIMNSTNETNGFISTASSIFNNNNDCCGPYYAFNQSSSNFWHSNTTDTTKYDLNTGKYIGTNNISYIDYDGNNQIAYGESLEIKCPSNHILLQYDIQGRQDCCGESNISGRSPNSWIILGKESSEDTWKLLDQQENQNLNYRLMTYTIPSSYTHSYNQYCFITTNCGSPDDITGNRYCVQIAQWNLYDLQSPPSSSSSTKAMNPISNDSLTFDECQQQAYFNNFSYFSLNNIDNNGRGICNVSNDIDSIQQYGPGESYNEIILWSSNTSTLNGKIVTLNGDGTLQIINGNGTVVYSTPNNLNSNTKIVGSNYIGCYNLNKDQLNSNNIFGDSYQYTSQECLDKINSLNLNYMGLFGGTRNDNNNNTLIEICTGSSNINDFIKYGISNQCNQPYGSPSSISLYGKNSFSYLQIDDNGLLTIYNGTQPSDNQGIIWSTNTSNTSQDSNNSYSASNSIFNRDYMLSGEQLMPGQFIGSSTGKTYLIFRPSGSLDLCTSQKKSSCIQNTNLNNTYTSTGISNAVYNFIDGTIKQGLQNFGNVGYITEDGKKETYSMNNLQYIDQYSVLPNLNTSGNDINGLAKSNISLNDCKQLCSSTSDCSGFVYDVSGQYENTCYPKNSNMFPWNSTTNVQPSNGLNIYVRMKGPNEVPIGIDKNSIYSITSTQWNGYPTNGEVNFNKQYGIANVDPTTNQIRSYVEQKLQEHAQIQESQIYKDQNDINQKQQFFKEGFKSYIHSFVKKNQQTQRMVDESTLNVNYYVSIYYAWIFILLMLCVFCFIFLFK